jgi:hypothetical protein
MYCTHVAHPPPVHHQRTAPEILVHHEIAKGKGTEAAVAADQKPTLCLPTSRCAHARAHGKPAPMRMESKQKPSSPPNHPNQQQDESICANKRCSEEDMDMKPNAPRATAHGGHNRWNNPWHTEKKNVVQWRGRANQSREHGSHGRAASPVGH